MRKYYCHVYSLVTTHDTKKITSIKIVFDDLTAQKGTGNLRLVCAPPAPRPPAPFIQNRDHLPQQMGKLCIEIDPPPPIKFWDYPLP